MNYGFETRCIHGNGTDEKTHSYVFICSMIQETNDLKI